MRIRAFSSLLSARSFGVLVAAAALSACGGGGGSSLFQPVNALRSTRPGLPFRVDGRWLVYLADEATTGPGGTDLNDDGDRVDAVAVAVDINGRDEFVIGVAARDVAVFDNQVFLVVAEAEDGRDHNTDGSQDDLVLFHWNQGDGATFVDTLRPGLSGADPLVRVVADARLYYATAGPPIGVDATTVRYLTSSAPTLPIEVSNERGEGSVRPFLLGTRDGMVFLGIDEGVETEDQNDDTDDEDALVLALLDGRDPTAHLKSARLALDPLDPQFAALRTDDDYLVAFLVSEAAQGVDLNDPADFEPAFEPAQCVAEPDTDQADDVLVFLCFEDFCAGLSGPVSTGLAGRDRIVIAGTYLGVLSPEGAASCDLNADGDRDDDVFRWVHATTPVLPAVLPDELFALASGIAGGSFGIAELQNRFLIVVDEEADGRDQDGDGRLDFDLLAWLDPSSSEPFRFLQRDPDGFDVFVGVDEMARTEAEFRVTVSFQESVQGLNLNTQCKVSSFDSDQSDSLPAFVRFDASTSPAQLIVPGVGFALLPGRGGTVVFRNHVFFRATESGNQFDFNGDGDLVDVMIVRNPVFACAPVIISVASDVDGPVIQTGGSVGAAFLADEAMAGIDFNGDGDKDDLVVRYFDV